MAYLLQSSTNGKPRATGGGIDREGPLGLDEGTEIEAGRVEPLQIGVGPRGLILLPRCYPGSK